MRETNWEEAGRSIRFLGYGFWAGAASAVSAPLQALGFTGLMVVVAGHLLDTLGPRLSKDRS